MRKAITGRSRQSHDLDELLSSYALAATAAGVTLLAASPLQAEVIYTPTNITIAHGSLPIDLNGDGVNDFVLVDNFYNVPRSKFPLISSRRLVLGGNPSASAIPLRNEAAVLHSGAVIGSSRTFSPVRQPRLPMAAAKFIYHGTTGTCCVDFYGNWQNVKNHYLGLKFKINGQVHFGWARLTVKSFQDPNNYVARINVTLSGYAYESNPNQSIVAGNEGGSSSSEAVPSTVKQTLGTLALGAQGATIWRRREVRSGD